MKKLFFTILLLILFFGLLPIAKADQQLLLKYPEISGIKIGEGTTLPEIIKYIYLFSLGIVGLMAFVSIIIGAVQYITSAGNDTKIGDAKDRITSALLGILILLASVLILRTINPDLINIDFKLPAIVAPGPPSPTMDYYCYGCCDELAIPNDCDDFYKQWSCFKLEGFNEYATANKACEVTVDKSCGVLNWRALFLTKTQPCPTK